jgi:hypothetical protein
MLELDLMIGHEARPFEQYFLLTISVNPSAETGDGGVLEIVVTSESNSANRSGRVTVSLDVQIIYELTFMSENIETEYIVSYSEKTEFEIELHNIGNIRTEVRIFASENLRGWSISLDNDYECNHDGGGLVCWIDVGSSVLVEVIIRPPVDAEMKDTFKFTLSSEPVETGVVDRQNIEFTIQSKHDSGFFGEVLGNNTNLWIASG